VARPAAPLDVIVGYCSRCGYKTHPSECADHPCHRCSHDRQTRNDGTRGYVIERFLECPCKCHRAWREAYDAALESEGRAQYVPAEPPRGRHTPADDDWA
jgi:hypothetical protein